MTTTDRTVDGPHSFPTPPAPPRAGSDARASAKPTVGEGAAGMPLGYQPALDGLRGLALLAIVVFHSSVPWAPGAFLSVSTFFTLSGFLITTLILAEHDTTGRLSIRGFYGRRARRLLPASLAAISVIFLSALVLADSYQLARLRGDGLASLFYVANWRFVLAGDSYGEIFSTPSPFTHFWTLGIEEQYYVVFPVVVGLVLWRSRGSKRVLAAVLGVLAVGSVVWSAFLLGRGASIDRVYFGTDTRLAELLAGALLAIWWSRARPLSGRASRLVRWAGCLALGFVLVLWTVARQNDELFYKGGLALYSGLTLLVILAAIEATGPVRRVLGWRPLVVVGMLSYSAYLLHWPVLVWLHAHTALSAGLRLAVGLALTLIFAAASYRLVEHPIRRGNRFRGRLGAVASISSVAVLACVILIAGTLRAPAAPANDFGSASKRLTALGAGAGAAGADPAEQRAARERAIAELSPAERAEFERWRARQEGLATSKAPKVALFGDSTALMTGFGVADWGMDHLDQLAPAPGETDVGCGLLTGVMRKLNDGEIAVGPECDGWLDRWRGRAEATRIDVAVIQLGPWEVVDQQAAPGGPFLAIGHDAALDDTLRGHLDEAVRMLTDRVGYVIIILPPDIEFGRVDGRPPQVERPDSDPARMARFREIIQEVATRNAPGVAVVDLARYIAGRPDDARLRPDGVHFTESTSREVAEWLAPELLSTYARRQPR